MTDVTVLEFTNSTAVLKDHFGYDALKGVLARYKKSERKRVDYLEVLEINDRKKYLKDFLVVVSTQVAGETRILGVQYRKKPVFLNIVNLLRKMLKGFLNVAKEVFDPPIKTEPRKEIGSRTEIKEWMR
ncbi:hypothetical protein THIOM_004968 [Candidatus Thiomargarita nelsonii]|uniref:Uncharacterized protein n=1 Tax=Candidatus Thiomargarita nelsonii TaxID=1003181 RepID=A0A176RUH7_9GAMM|nr:hypothetical protein THIOM_004968 [Candidatus Thiomargarita nelsonii]